MFFGLQIRIRIPLLVTSRDPDADPAPAPDLAPDLSLLGGLK
jgi:hypothetical protein